jgi:hypothetical protein
MKTSKLAPMPEAEETTIGPRLPHTHFSNHQASKKGYRHVANPVRKPDGTDLTQHQRVTMLRAKRLGISYEEYLRRAAFFGATGEAK